MTDEEIWRALVMDFGQDGALKRARLNGYRVDPAWVREVPMSHSGIEKIRPMVQPKKEVVEYPGHVQRYGDAPASTDLKAWRPPKTGYYDRKSGVEVPGDEDAEWRKVPTIDPDGTYHCNDPDCDGVCMDYGCYGGTRYRRLDKPKGPPNRIERFKSPWTPSLGSVTLLLVGGSCLGWVIIQWIRLLMK